MKFVSHHEIPGLRGGQRSSQSKSTNRSRHSRDGSIGNTGIPLGTQSYMNKLRNSVSKPNSSKISKERESRNYGNENNKLHFKTKLEQKE
jgi:hypothetical protein